MTFCQDAEQAAAFVLYLARHGVAARAEDGRVIAIGVSMTRLNEMWDTWRRELAAEARLAG